MIYYFQHADVASFIIQMIILLLSIVISARVYKRRRSLDMVFGRLREYVVVDERNIVLNEKYLFEKGEVLIASPQRTMIRGYTHAVKWRGEKTFFETNLLSLHDLCSRPPFIFKEKRYFNVFLPAVRIRGGKLDGLIIACFNTNQFHAYSQSSIVYNSGFAKSEVFIKPGHIRVKVEWMRIIPSIEDESTRRETLLIKLCRTVKPFLCIELAEIDKPGVIEIKETFPKITKVIILHKYSAKLDEVLDIVKDFSKGYCVENSSLKIIVKKIV